jgi:hypothetical protein
MFTEARHRSLSWAKINPVHTLQNYFPTIHFNVIPSSTPRSSTWSLPCRISNQNFVRSSHFPHACHTPRTSQPPWFDCLNNIIEEYKLWSSSLWDFLQPPVTLSLLGPNILLSTLFSNTPNLCSSLSVRNNVSHPYNTTGKIIVAYVLIFTFLENRHTVKEKCYFVSEL